jgi:hypothetical protein
VLTGRYQGHQVVAFDYSYGSYRQGMYRFSVVVVRLQAALPLLEVTEEAPLDNVRAAALGHTRIEVESERFNDEYCVMAADERFGHAVIHPRMMELLLNRGDAPWRIEGADLLGWAGGRLEPADLLVRAELLAEIADQIPPFVWSDYGADPRLNA